MAIVVGILSYGCGYSYQSGFSLTVVTLFWVGHFPAFYMTASTAVKVLGRRVLKTLRTRMLRKGEVRLIYDAMPDAIRLAGERKTGRWCRCRSTPTTWATPWRMPGAAWLLPGEGRCAPIKSS